MEQRLAIGKENAAKALAEFCMPIREIVSLI